MSHSKVLCSFSCFLTECGKWLMICVLICKAYMSLRELHSDFMATVAYNSHFNGKELQLKERILGASVTVITKCSVKMPTLLELQIKWTTSFQLSFGVRTGAIYLVTHKKILNGVFPQSSELVKPCFLWSNALHPDSGPESVPASLLRGAAACYHRLAHGQEAGDAAVGRGLGHADYPDQILWHGQQRITNLGPFSSPGLHKTCRISISLNLAFVKGGEVVASRLQHYWAWSVWSINT